MSKAYASSNGHLVVPLGRLWFMVSSASRNGHQHFVDFERIDDETGEIRIVPQCVCESKKFRGGVCRHCEAALEFIAEQRAEFSEKPEPKPSRRIRKYTLK